MHSKLYIKIMNSKQWREVRDKKRAADPLCEECKKRGTITPMREVHHIVEVESGHTDAECWQIALSWNNLQSLCRRCHKEKHTHCSHTKEGHKQRNATRLQQWINRNTKNKNDNEQD